MITEDGRAFAPLCYDPDGHLYCNDDEVNFGALTRLDGETLREILPRHTGGLATHEHATVVSLYTLAGRTDFLLTRDRQLGETVIGVLKCADMSFIAETSISGVTEVNPFQIGGLAGFGYGKGCSLAPVGGGATLKLIKTWIGAAATSSCCSRRSVALGCRWPWTGSARR